MDGPAEPGPAALDRPAMATAAEGAGARDLFVLRQVDDHQWANVGGHGQGDGWAGSIAVNVDREPLLAEAVAVGLARRWPGVPSRVFGPYWSDSAAAVHRDGHLVVLGGPGVAGAGDADLAGAAGRAVAAAAGVAIDKRRADEAEVAQAVQLIDSAPGATVDEVAAAVAGRAARVLSCEFGAVLLAGAAAAAGAGGVRVVVAAEGWRPPGTDDELVAGLLPVLAAARHDPFVEQDLADSPLAVRPFTFDDGLVSRCSVGLGAQAALGVLVVAHAGSAPRGFTRLCRRLARAVAVTATARLERAPMAAAP